MTNSDGFMKRLRADLDRLMNAIVTFPGLIRLRGNVDLPADSGYKVGSVLIDSGIVIQHRNASAPTYFPATYSGLAAAMAAFDPEQDAVIRVPAVVITGATPITVDKAVRISGELPGPQSDTDRLIYHVTLLGKFTISAGCRLDIENAYVVGPITVGDGATFAAKHCAFKTGSTSVTVPDGPGYTTVILDQCVVLADAYAVESLKTAGTLVVQFLESHVSGLVSQDAYVHLEVTDGRWNQRDAQKDSPYWAYVGVTAGFLTSAAHAKEHAEDIRDNAFVHHVPRPTAAGTRLVSSGAGWVEAASSHCEVAQDSDGDILEDDDGNILYVEVLE